jgi:hypothetical protein
MSLIRSNPAVKHSDHDKLPGKVYVLSLPAFVALPLIEEHVIDPQGPDQDHRDRKCDREQFLG